MSLLLRNFVIWHTSSCVPHIFTVSTVSLPCSLVSGATTLFYFFGCLPCKCFWEVTNSLLLASIIVISLFDSCGFIVLSAHVLRLCRSCFFVLYALYSIHQEVLLFTPYCLFLVLRLPVYGQKTFSLIFIACIICFIGRYTSSPMSAQL